MADVAGFRLGDLAQWAGVELRGDPEIRVTGVATIEGAGPRDVTFLANPRYRRFLASTRAAAVVLHPDEADGCPTAALLSTNPYLLFARIVAYMCPPPATEPGVHPTAWVDPTASLGEGVSIGPQAVIHRGARIGAGTSIGSGAVVEADAAIGRDCRIGTNVTIGARVVIGDRVVIHPGAVLGADGFGFADTRAAARRFFHIDGPSMAVKALQMLADRGEIDPDVPRQAFEKYQLLDVNAGTSGTVGGDA